MDTRMAGAGVGLTKESLSTQMARAKASGTRVNLCPFGCDENELNENTYCKHLVGFTADGKKFEPRFVNEFNREVVLGECPEDVLDTDQVRWITSTARVYRKTGNAPRKLTDKKVAEQVKKG